MPSLLALLVFSFFFFFGLLKQLKPLNLSISLINLIKSQFNWAKLLNSKWSKVNWASIKNNNKRWGGPFHNGLSFEGDYTPLYLHGKLGISISRVSKVNDLKKYLIQCWMVCAHDNGTRCSLCNRAYKGTSIMLTIIEVHGI